MFGGKGPAESSPLPGLHFQNPILLFHILIIRIQYSVPNKKAERNSAPECSDIEITPDTPDFNDGSDLESSFHPFLMMSPRPSLVLIVQLLNSELDFVNTKKNCC